MAEKSQPHDTPRRPFKEYEDNHFHDDDDVAPPPNDEVVPHATDVPRQPARPVRKLPPPPRRFFEE